MIRGGVMNIIKSVLLIGTFSLAIAGCSPAPESAQGFRLPDGDRLTGKQAFLDLQCHACHMIQGMELPSVATEVPVSVTLGGPVTRVKTYGQLVTSIINPSHKLVRRYPADEVSVDGESFMPVMNEFMTVRQLIDLVAFLQDQYQIVIPEPYPYRPYSP
jgi:mono/diheme cytochrome c family protein